MNPSSAISSARRPAGIMLIECMVYLAVFVILLGIGTAAFFFCWDHTRALIFATDDIAAALHAGERWRADVRSATGNISVETTAAGQVVRIPEAGVEIVYRFASNEVCRESSTVKIPELLLPKVKAGLMQADARGPVKAWRWELELTSRRKEAQLPLRFTFEA